MEGEEHLLPVVRLRCADTTPGLMSLGCVFISKEYKHIKRRCYLEVG
jgi:hypothetical protein